MQKEKVINLRLTEEQHREIKLLATQKGFSIKSYLLNLVRRDKKKENTITINGVILESLDEEDRKDIEKGKDDIVNNNYEDMDKVFRELDTQDESKNN